jgi:DNA replicative helicase MCM subunit Mcm2 (Cdc46/Mcm family)
MYDVTGLKRIKLEGYSRPNNWETTLSDPEKNKKPVRDIRKTLYWNPSVQLDKDVNTYSIRFKNNDVTTRFRLIAEGVNKEGKLIRLEKIIEQP